MAFLTIYTRKKQKFFFRHVTFLLFPYYKGEDKYKTDYNMTKILNLNISYSA